MTRVSIAAALAAVLLAGCAAYNELSPEPPVTPLERGYIELKEGEKPFMLEKGEKYYMQFPAPTRNDFTLVLATDKKWTIDQLLTTVFDDKDGPGERIPDEAAESESLMVYPVGPSGGTYYWVIENVRSEVELTMRYRYVPRWRYQFETREVALRSTLQRNAVDRTQYNAIDDAYSFGGFDFRGVRSQLDTKSRNLAQMQEEMKGLEAIVPPEILTSTDTAAVRYRQLRDDLTDEVAFQASYAQVLSVFEKLEETKGNTGAFLREAPLFTRFLKDEQSHPARIASRVRRDVSARLGETFPHYDKQVHTKTDVSPIVLAPPLEPVLELHRAAGVSVPQDLSTLSAFVNRFNVEAGALKSAREKLQRLETLGGPNVRWTSDSLYAGLIATAADVARMTPQSQLDSFTGYAGLPYVARLKQEIATTAARAAAFQKLYQSARSVGASIAAGQWQEAETVLRALFQDPQFTPHPPVQAQKGRLVAEFEEEIASAVTAASRTRAEQFAAANQTTLDNVKGLYANEAFTPVYQLTFSAKGEADRRNRQVQEGIDRIRYYSFPENSIRAIYRELTTKMNDRGAEKVRAIVEHGSMYKGNDKQIRAIIDECNVQVPKAIAQAKEYRRVFALPVTANPTGTNEYMFRILLQIPSDAQFPVFDVNVKLPKEVAQNAGRAQWYDAITINSKPIKNEGRFRITSPTAENGYESLITPVQMDKGGKNILEVRFRYPGYRIFEVSAMAQVPIIRKN